MSRAGSVKKDPDSGRWRFVVDLAPPGAVKRKQVKRQGFPTKKAAQDALDEVKNSARTGMFVEPSRQTLGGYLKDWLAGLPASGLKANTIAGYRSKAKYVTTNEVAEIPVQAVTAVDLNVFYSVLLEEGAANSRGPLSASSVRACHVVVTKAMHDAVRTGLLARNVAEDATPPSTVAAKAPEFTAWTPEELRWFLNWLSAAGRRGEPHHHFAMFRLMGMTGLRRGEACGLRWPDLDLDAARLTMRHTIYVVDGKAITGGTGKTKRSRRTIDLDPVTVAVLKAHRKAQLETRVLMGAGYRDEGYTFAHPTGRYWHPQTITQAFARLAERADVPSVRLHDLRHSHAVHLLVAGTGAEVVSARLGHSSVAFTLNTYAHVTPQQAADAATAAAALVDG